MSRVNLGPAEAIPKGQVAGFQIRLWGPDGPHVTGPSVVGGPGDTIPVAVAHTRDDRWYAIGDLCSHGPVRLSEGALEGCNVECWSHGSRFDLATGQPVNFPATDPVPTYPVGLQDGAVYIEIGA
ncbi:MAG: non-heme iron oxygenase ferredoxin subunit [Bifidobacteriaceae bacterium]|nr:non-heme iron oxygenase ferredoxin subunit [Bifidobacteriaceae bacterium]